MLFKMSDIVTLEKDDDKISSKPILKFYSDWVNGQTAAFTVIDTASITIIAIDNVR